MDALRQMQLGLAGSDRVPALEGSFQLLEPEVVSGGRGMPAVRADGVGVAEGRYVVLHPAKVDQRDLIS